MKYLIGFLLAITISPCFSQTPYVPRPIELDQITKKYTTVGVVQVDSMTAPILMDAVFKWLSEVKYVNSLASKGMKLDEAAFYKFQVYQHFESINKYKVRFVIYLEFKDNRFKYTFTDFSHVGTGQTEFENMSHSEQIKLRNIFIRDANEYIAKWLNELITYLNEYQPDKSW